MKYIVLSFDDGFTDFKNNALPVLEKYGVKVSLNIVSGYADRTVHTEYDCLSIDDIKRIHNLGHEIALHSDSHLHKTNIEDYRKCYKKIASWLNISNFGAVIPFSQKVDENLLDYFIENKYLYICDYSHPNTIFSLKAFLFRIKNYFFRTNDGNDIVFGLTYIYSKDEFKNSRIPAFKRMPIRFNISAEQIIKMIELMPNNGCMTIVFHSIINDVKEDCEWKEGAWTVKNLEKLVAYCVKNRNCKILRQRELFNENDC